VTHASRGVANVRFDVRFGLKSQRASAPTMPGAADRADKFEN
jgi:hypothetical protein